jgi:uncharacterized protein YqcC (DUF446 family)
MNRFFTVVCQVVFAGLAALCISLLRPRQQIIVVPGLCLVFIFIFAMALRRDGRTQRRRSGSSPGPDHRKAALKVDEIEHEMRRIRLWQDQPLAREKYNFTKAFAMDTMSYDQWLQFVFIPRVREIVSTAGQFPESSSVGAQAIREFDTYPDSERLVTLLCEFDRLFQHGVEA